MLKSFTSSICTIRTVLPMSGAAIFRSCRNPMAMQARMFPHSTIREHFQLLAKHQRRPVAAAGGQTSSAHEKKQVDVLRLIQAYRMRGHQASDLDPLGLWKREEIADLTLADYGLTDADLDTPFRTGELHIGKEEAPLREILDVLKATYCSTFGAEYMHIVDSAQRRWFQQRLESVRGKPQHSTTTKRHLLERLTAAEGLEKYLGTKFRAPNDLASRVARA